MRNKIPHLLIPISSSGSEEGKWFYTKNWSKMGFFTESEHLFGLGKISTGKKIAPWNSAYLYSAKHAVSTYQERENNVSKEIKEWSVCPYNASFPNHISPISIGQKWKCSFVLFSLFLLFQGFMDRSHHGTKEFTPPGYRTTSTTS